VSRTLIPNPIPLGRFSPQRTKARSTMRPCSRRSTSVCMAAQPCRQVVWAKSLGNVGGDAPTAFSPEVIMGHRRRPLRPAGQPRQCCGRRRNRLLVSAIYELPIGNNRRFFSHGLGTQAIFGDGRSAPSACGNRALPDSTNSSAIQKSQPGTEAHSSGLIVSATAIWPTRPGDYQHCAFNPTRAGRTGGGSLVGQAP
jgi:hypothetical protein